MLLIAKAACPGILNNGIEKIAYRLNEVAFRLFPLVHERAEILQIAVRKFVALTQSADLPSGHALPKTTRWRRKTGVSPPACNLLGNGRTLCFGKPVCLVPFRNFLVGIGFNFHHFGRT